MVLLCCTRVLFAQPRLPVSDVAVCDRFAYCVSSHRTRDRQALRS